MALKGVTVLELAGLAPVPFAGMALADFGAKVIRVDRVGGIARDGLGRGKRSICLNLKRQEGAEAFKKLCKNVDVIIEPFRPGVMEKLGLGPDVLMKKNPRLIYARLTGFGQKGPYKLMAGHDINYIATSGILSFLSREGEPPHPPINIIADFAGGGLTCAFGILAALFEREKSGKGQVVDTNMVEGSAYVSSFAYATKHSLFVKEPGKNLLDTGAPFYDCYPTKDGRFVAVGALEPKFYKELMEGLGLDHDALPHQMDFDGWPQLRKAIGEAIAQHTMKELEVKFEGKDACLTPVLTPDEAAVLPHNVMNKSFFKSADGLQMPHPAPRLSRTMATPDTGEQPTVGVHTKEVLLENGFSSEEIAKLEKDKVIDCQSKL